MVGVEAPEFEAEVVKAQSDALAAREVRRGRATDAAGAELSMEEAGLLSERGTEETLGLVEEICERATAAGSAQS